MSPLRTESREHSDDAVVGALLRRCPTVSPDTLNLHVAQMFEDDRDSPAFAVVSEGVPVGLIDRLGFMSRFAARYGREMFVRKPISRLMDAEPLVVDAGLSVDRVGKMIFAEKPKALHTGFVMTRDGLYAGVGAGVDLLQALTRSLAAANERLRQTQNSLVQAEKMAALGALVAGVAHEVNTPVGSALTAATAFGERARAFAQLTSGGSIRRSDIDRFVVSALEASDLMQSNIRRASELVTGFKQVAVDQTSDTRRRFVLRRCLEDILLSLSPRLRKEATHVVLDCPPELEMDGYPGAMAQIVSNLIMNALVHAFDGRGDRRITVCAAKSPTAETEAEILLTVSDNGCGIPPALKPRVFDPFFTTRRGNGGSGLGLHIVFNLVTQRSGGVIGIEDAADGGTRFVMRLPTAAP